MPAANATHGDASRRAPLTDRVHVDESTGRRYLKLSLPEPAAVQRLADALGEWLATWRRSA